MELVIINKKIIRFHLHLYINIFTQEILTFGFNVKWPTLINNMKTFMEHSRINYDLRNPSTKSSGIYNHI